MTAPVEARPYLVEAPRPAVPAVVVGTGAAPVGGPALRLLPRRGEGRPVSRAAPREAGEVVVALELPGLGARYLTGVAQSATGSGWTAPEVGALIVELQARCTYWLAAPRADRAAGAPRAARGTWGRRSCVIWSGDRFTRSRGSAGALRDVVAAALERDATVAVASSGTALPRDLGAALTELSAAGIDSGRMSHGGDRRRLGRWAVEALGAPRLDGRLGRLREQFASAPRCGWCALPVIGRRCRRCSPGAER
jgi:hypothetical protein